MYAVWNTFLDSFVQFIPSLRVIPFLCSWFSYLLWFFFYDFSMILKFCLLTFYFYIEPQYPVHCRIKSKNFQTCQGISALNILNKFKGTVFNMLNSNLLVGYAIASAHYLLSHLPYPIGFDKDFWRYLIACFRLYFVQRILPSCYSCFFHT